MPEFAPVLVVSALNGTNGYRLDGEAVVDYSGSAVAGGGDVNGDGFADLLIGAPFSDTSGVDRGLAWVVFGGVTPPAAQGLAARVAAGTAYRFQGEGAGDRAGSSLANAGDVNGDGFDDFIIGARYADPDAAPGDRGASYLVFGGAAKLEIADAADGLNDNQVALTALSSATGFRFDGISNADRSGFSVSSAGDVNGDGFTDLIIGAPYAEPLAQELDNDRLGESYIVFGGANLTALDAEDGSADGRIDLANVSAGQGLRLDGDASRLFDQSGTSVALVGDVNGDGFDDALVGAPKADANLGVGGGDHGAAYLVFGRPQGLFTTANLALADLDGVTGTRFDGVNINDRAGQSVNGLGDINGDGLADIVIGASNADPSGDYSGSAFVVFGKTAFAASRHLATLSGTDGFRLNGLRASDSTGASVSSAGDVNGDGFGDILIGAPGFNRLGATDAGAAYVVFGKASGFAAVIDVGSLDGDTGFRIEGAVGGDRLGLGSLGAAGDVNGDGFDDIVVGASDADNNAFNYSGSTYIIYGHRADTAVTRTGTARDNIMNGGRSDDTMSGNDGNDTLIGWEGDDTINGGGGNDTLNGGADDDAMSGGSGADTFLGGEGSDQLFGGSGGDTVSYINSLALVKLALDGTFAAEGDATGDTFSSVERITGSNFDDRLRGNAQDNRLIGGNGVDTLEGANGNDTFLGGGGADILNGGLGDDGFDFTATSHSGDIIQDFSNAVGNNDSLRFKGSAFGALAVGALDPIRFLANTTGLASNSSQRFIYETDTGILRYDSNGTGAGGITIMATLTGNPALTAADIVII